MTTQCFQCGGPWHPATGYHYPEQDVRFCGVCARGLFKWLKNQFTRKFKKDTKRPEGAETFYDAALTSIGARRRYCGGGDGTSATPPPPPQETSQED